MSVEGVFDRLQSGNFDAYLDRCCQRPNVVAPVFVLAFRGQRTTADSTPARPSMPRSIGFAAASNDAEYQAGVAAFQQAIVDDPPAIFLAWSDAPGR